MLQGQHLRKSYGAVTVISDVSFILNDKQHVGLIGPNGVGKSTLLRCLIGAEQLDAGTIVKSPPDLSIGYLASDERVEKPREHWGLKLDFGPPPPSGQAVLRLEDVSFGYAGQPLLFSEVTLDVRYSERIAVVGPNGAGKTTLLRLIAGQMPPQTGTVRLGVNVRLGVMAQEQETLDLRRTVLQTVRQERAMSETEARHFLHFFLFGGDSVFRPVGACSLGERSRLQLARLVLRGCNFLLLDEPLNHLDIEGREHFEAALDAFGGPSSPSPTTVRFCAALPSVWSRCAMAACASSLAATTTTSSASGGDDLATTCTETTRRSARPPTWRRTWNSWPPPAAAA